MKVLLATDGSQNADRAARWLVGLKSELNVPLQVLVSSIHDDTPYSGGMRHLGRADVEAALKEQAAKDAASVQAILQEGGLTPELKLEIGPVAQTLAGIAKREGCAMIVMGQKGRSTLANLLMGSIATRVVSISEVPVTLVR